MGMKYGYASDPWVEHWVHSYSIELVIIGRIVGILISLQRERNETSLWALSLATR